MRGRRQPLAPLRIWCLAFDGLEIDLHESGDAGRDRMFGIERGVGLLGILAEFTEGLHHEIARVRAVGDNDNLEAVQSRSHPHLSHKENHAQTLA